MATPDANPSMAEYNGSNGAGVPTGMGFSHADVSFDRGVGGWQSAAPQPGGLGWDQSWQGDGQAAKRPRFAADGGMGAGQFRAPEAGSGEQDTLLITGISEQVLQQVLVQLDGFVTSRTAMGESGDPLCFAKFLTPGHAKAAVQMAVSAGINSSNVRFAKTSMSTGQPSGAAAPATFRRPDFPPQQQQQQQHAPSIPKPEKEIPPPGEQTMALAQFGGTTTGILKANNTNFGFIKQDSGEEDLFVMPFSCEGFGMVLPPVGTRLVFTIGMDKTRPGRVRAQNVAPA
jgi:cold shock CspA family protein